MRHPEKSHAGPVVYRGFDISGQVFTENIVAARDPIWDWPLKTRGSATSLSYFRSPGPGCSSLLDIAIRACLVRSTWLTPALVGSLPWNLACKLWNELIKNELDSVRIWQAFAASWPEAGPALKWKIQRVRHAPSLPLELFTEPLCSDKGHWLSILTLQNIHVPRRSLVQGVAKITNLMALTIGKDVMIEPGMAIDDGIFRAWAGHYEEFTAKVSRDEPTRERNTLFAPFGKLKVLNLKLQPHITARTFEHLGCLPQLSVINTEFESFGFCVVDDAKKLGWRLLPSEDPCLASQKNQAGRISWDALIRTSLAWSESGTDGPDKSAAAGLHCEVKSPVLHLIVGPHEMSADSNCLGLDGYQGNAGIKKRRLATFARNLVDGKTRLHTRDSGLKRVLQGDGNGPSVPQKKKFGPRSAKLQDVDDLLKDFGHSTSAEI